MTAITSEGHSGIGIGVVLLFIAALIAIIVGLGNANVQPADRTGAREGEIGRSVETERSIEVGRSVPLEQPNIAEGNLGKGNEAPTTPTVLPCYDLNDFQIGTLKRFLGLVRFAAERGLIPLTEMQRQTIIELITQAGVQAMTPLYEGEANDALAVLRGSELGKEYAERIGMLLEQGQEVNPDDLFRVSFTHQILDEVERGAICSPSLEHPVVRALLRITEIVSESK